MYLFTRAIPDHLCITAIIPLKTHTHTNTKRHAIGTTTTTTTHNHSHQSHNTPLNLNPTEPKVVFNCSIGFMIITKKYI